MTDFDVRPEAPKGVKLDEQNYHGIVQDNLTRAMSRAESENRSVRARFYWEIQQEPIRPTMQEKITHSVYDIAKGNTGFEFTLMPSAPDYIQKVERLEVRVRRRR